MATTTVTAIPKSQSTLSIPLSENLEAQLETYMHSVFHAAKHAARGQRLSEENVKAKMFDYAMRMLHACGWKPGTILRAMSMMEGNQDKKTYRIMNDAKRAIRDERREMFQDGEKGLSGGGVGSLQAMRKKGEMKTENKAGTESMVVGKGEREMRLMQPKLLL